MSAMPRLTRQPTTAHRNGKALTARTADRYDLYLQSVQAPDFEVHFFDRAFQAVYGRKPALLREDFCGTFAVCCEWVKRRAGNEAIGVDLDPQPLHWGRQHNLAPLSPAQQQRVTLVQADVRQPLERKADLIAGQNFSWFIFTTRDDLRGYFRAAYENLADEGVLVLDIMGGPDCMKEDQRDTRRQKGFRYIWEQVRFDPISHYAKFHIHFEFPDGTKIKRAFTYEWRLWTLPETVELLREAGFTRVDIYWEGTDRATGKGNDVYTRRSSAPADLTWVAYIAAAK
jgi:hypothetical protein